MRSMIGIGLLAGTLLLSGRPAGAAADPAYQEKLEKIQTQIDATVAQTGGGIAKKLADRFELKPEDIQKIRDGGPMTGFEGSPGWGEITILLSMARQLKKTHTADYPTYKKALDKILSARSEKSSFEKIANTLEFNLQPVIVETQHIQANLQSERKRSPSEN